MSASILALPEFRRLLAANSFSNLAHRGLNVVVGFQIYEITGDPLALGLIGLIQAIPAVSLALFGGYLADRYDRRAVILATRALEILCALSFALFTISGWAENVFFLYLVIFFFGLAHGFFNPAMGAFEAQVVPVSLAVKAASWLSSFWQGTAILGPALAGFAYQWLGPAASYGAIACLLVLSLLSVRTIPARPLPAFATNESLWQSIGAGVRYVFGSQVLVGSMALDLFAVLFGGAVALLPVFAKDILAVGPSGLGFLNAAPGVGALLVMLICTRHPPQKRAGPIFLVAVAGFGISMIVFGFSNSYPLSLAALVLAGASDGVSVIVRRSIIRFYSPDAMRGRIAAVSSIFIGSSNEIGAFESGVAASLLGTRRAVWLGGMLTLLVVASASVWAPKLRRLNLAEAAKRAPA